MHDGCGAALAIVAILFIALMWVLSARHDYREDGYRAGWCEGRGGQWVEDACVDSLRVRTDTTGGRP